MKNNTQQTQQAQQAQQAAEALKDMTLDEFIQACLEYNEAAEVKPDLSKLEVCPVHQFAVTHSKACYRGIAGIKSCPLCGAPICPECGRHNVTQLSRVTGYMSSVDGWNAAKKQELQDRKRYQIGRG